VSKELVIGLSIGGILSEHVAFQACMGGVGFFSVMDFLVMVMIPYIMTNSRRIMRERS
jgi:esterase/lipase